MTNSNWEIPADQENAEDRIRQLQDDVQHIEGQLSDRSRKVTMPIDDYWLWRHKAIWALTQRLSELRWLKSWLRGDRSVMHSGLLVGSFPRKDVPTTALHD
jgi:hypothetical protein